MNAAPDARKVAVITGASQGIGAGLTAGYRQAGYAVVGVALSMLSSDEQDYLTIQGDITEAETAQHVVDHALDRFGRVDTLVNNTGIYIGKPFTITHLMKLFGNLTYAALMALRLEAGGGVDDTLVGLGLM